MFAPDRFVAALRFAAERHHAQLVPGSELPYLVHVTSVTAEVIAALPGGDFDPDLAIVCALLHDTIEDTTQAPAEAEALRAEIANRFGRLVAEGVDALSKDAALPKDQRMADSLRRIREQPKAVWAVKLADRITNLAPPPTHWTKAKCGAYRVEAQQILGALGEASPALADRLRSRIESYSAYC